MSAVSCPQGWKWHSPSCFWLGEDRVTYSDARKLCSDYGSTLVTITNRSAPRPGSQQPKDGVCPTAGFCVGWERGLGRARGLSSWLLPHRFEQAYVSSLIYGWDGEYFWTALQDINETGAFRWLSGDEVMYTHWNRDQPGKGMAAGGMWDGDIPFPAGSAPGRGPAVTPRLAPGYNKGGCVALATGSSMGLWEVKNCSTFKAKYICRQNLGTPVNPELPSPYPTPSLTGACPPGWSADPKLRHCYKVRGCRGRR